MISIKLTVGDVVEEYYAKTMDTMTVKDWYDLHSALTAREYRVPDGAIGGESELVDFEKESKEFQDEKIKTVISTYTNVPMEYLDRFLGLKEELLDLLPELSNYSNEVKDSFKMMGSEYFVQDLRHISFQQWADVESYTDIDKLAPIAILIMEKGSSYDYFNNDIHAKIKALYRLKASEYMATIIHIFSTIRQLRDSYYFVYNADYGQVSGYTNNGMKEHYKHFKWQDVVVTVAESGVFNGPLGSLHATRNANVLEVLYYLNIKRSREAAESRDQLANMNKHK